MYIKYILLFFIILVMYIIINNSINKLEFFNNINFKNLTYYRCDSKILGKITKDIFDENNIYQYNNEWNIYIPCGYNNVETELNQIKIKNPLLNKYIFGINGCDTIVSKNKIWESLVKCYGRTYASFLMPESYILNDMPEMDIFAKDFNPSKNDIYILKKNVQRKEGLKLTRDFNEIIQGYKEGYKVVQKYITNLYLINNRKVNLRIYLLIVIKEGKIYFHTLKNGKCIYTNKIYNDNDLDFESNITSYNLDMNIYKTNPRNFDELKKYIDNDRGINNGDKLFERIELLLKDISKCLSQNLYQSENIKECISFQLFGIDVIFDKNLKPYLLEINKGPDMSPRDEIDEIMKKNVQTDMFKIVGIL